jgi:hypothetical protein
MDVVIFLENSSGEMYFQIVFFNHIWLKKNSKIVLKLYSLSIVLYRLAIF